MSDQHGTKEGAAGAEAPHERRSSISILELPNFRRFWSIRKSGSGSEGSSSNNFMTGEVVPNLKNYQHRLSISLEGGATNRRLTLGELLNNNGEMVSSTVGDPIPDLEKLKSTEKEYKMNWVEGVFMTCLLNIWGVMLFLRLTWVIGEAGLIEGLAILTVSNTVTFLTSLSMSAVCTNGQITAGGIYYMISRALGPEFGGAIGLMFVLAQSMAIAMHLIGFCESFLDMLAQNIEGYESIMGYGRINDIRLLGMISLLCILGLAIVGMSWMTRVQYGLLAILILAQVDFVIGTLIPPSDEQKSKGFVGYSIENYKENMFSQYSIDSNTGNLHSFFSVFAVYFPSCTGIVAGANLSGDLKDPAGAIPKGTLLAVGTTYFSYILYGILSAGCSIRYASGVVAEYHYSENLLNETMADEMNITQAFNNCTDRTCEFGLIPSQQMIETMSAWGPLIYAGCFAATLSSAIACMFGAPRVFQAVAKDKLYPGLHFFAKGNGVNNDPFRGYGLVFVIAGTCILIGSLNQVSSVLSNFYVAAYALINFSVFHASITKSPGWRPTFKYHNRWLSLLGCLLCLAVMFLMDYRTAVGTYICILLLYIIIRSNKPDANWGSSNQSMSFVNALKSVQSLAKVEDHVKTYRPKIIVFSGEPSDRPSLMDFANLITKNVSLLQCINVVEEDVGWETMNANKVRINKWLAENQIKAFYSLIRHHDFEKGARISMEVAGLGKLSPNMILLGFQEKWAACPESARRYVSTLQSAFDLHMAVGIFRCKGGFDITSLEKPCVSRGSPSSRLDFMNPEFGSDDSFDSGISKSTASPKLSTSPARDFKFLGKIIPSQQSKSSQVIVTPTGTVIDDPNLVGQITQFKGKAPLPGKTIDVYWLFDDGGLTLLVPFILKMRSKFAKSQLRVFCLANDIENIEEETKNMTQLLKKFRIAFKDVTILSDAKKKPDPETSKQFEILISKISSTPTKHASDKKDVLISTSDLIKHREMTSFHLRIAEIVAENSKEAALVVMTLPLPKKSGLPAVLYMAWLDFISQNMPPFLFLRGNQVSVLTFYS